MTLPRLADLLAIHTPSADEHAVRKRLLEPHFDEVVGRDGWTIAVKALPHSGPEPDGARAAGLFFSEGAHRATAAGHGEPPDAIARLAREQPERLDRLPGDFGFLAVDGEGLTAVRSAGGLVPVYFTTAGGVPAVATRLSLLASYTEVPLEVDALVLGQWASCGNSGWVDGRSFLRDVGALRRGEHVRIDAGARVRRGRYWSPRGARARERGAPPPSPAVRREHAERLRALLVASIEEGLLREGGNLLTLSGGVDSSALGALAAGTLGFELATLTFHPADPSATALTSGYIDHLAQRVPLGPRLEETLDEPRHRALIASGPDVVFPMIHPALARLPSLREEIGVATLIGGEGADEVCGSGWTVPDWAEEVALGRLPGRPWALPSGPTDVLRWGKHRLLGAARRPVLPVEADLGELFELSVRAEHREWVRDTRRALAADDGPLRHTALILDLDVWIDMNWEAAATLGVRRVIPFGGREVIELAFECHPLELVGPGHKRLLRAALAGDVPPRNLERPDKGDARPPLEPPRVVGGPLHPGLAGLVRDDWLPAPEGPLGYLDRGRLATLEAFLARLDAVRARRSEILAR